jgi:hypothetical protein
MIHLLSGAAWIMAVLACHVSMAPPPYKIRDGQQFFLSRDHALRGARFHGEALTSTFTGKRPRIDAPAFTEKR